MVGRDETEQGEARVPGRHSAVSRVTPGLYAPESRIVLDFYD